MFKRISQFVLFSFIGTCRLFGSDQHAADIVIPDEAVVVSISQMTDQHYADFREGQCGELIVRVDEGSHLHTHFFMAGDTLALDNSVPMSARLLRTVFLRVIQGELQFSLDCRRWGSIHEVFRSNLAMMINVDHDIPMGAFALFLEGR